MTGRPVTDAQIARALRAHLPEAAAPGLRERVLDAAETTAQVRSFPSVLGALTDADPVGRRRSLLVAAALLLALALASAAAVGAVRLLQRDPIDEVSLEPPADVPAFVLSSYERLPQLPPLALTWHASDSTKGRIFVDRSGAVRFDRFASADATEPSTYRILSPDHRISGMALVDDKAVWVEPGHEAIGEDPRVFLRTVLSGGGDVPGCEMERDQSEVGNGTAAADWRYVGLADIAGRPTHHVTCGGGDLWIDIETRLILRTQGPAVDDAGRPVPVESTEVTEIAFAEQPAALFEPPRDLARMSEEEYIAYVCARDLPNELAPGISDCPTTGEAEATPPPEPAPTPTPTVRPDTSACAVPPGDPSEPIGPLAWTQESMTEDWPAPVRPEPAGGGRVQPMPVQYLDPVGDHGSTAFPCVDIRWLIADTSEVHLKLVSKPPPWSCSEPGACFGVDPSEQWIAYGVVTDEDGDGVPDWRYGTDNIPADVAEKGPPSRGWRTNLHTGLTEAGPGLHDPLFLNGGGFWSGLSTDSVDWEPDAKFGFGGAVNTTQGVQRWGFELDMPFYTWASVIVNGRVVATDYAPDSGWLVATPGVPLTPPRFPGGAYLIEELGIGLGFEDGGSLPLHVSMTVPHEWTVGGPWSSDSESDTRLEFGVVGHPWDGCPDTIEPELGPSYDDLVTYLADLPRIDISESTDVTVDGYRAKYLTYTPVDKWFDCFSASPIHLEPGNNEAWIVDVDGVRVEIAVVSDEPVSETVMSEIRQIVESIHFEP